MRIDDPWLTTVYDQYSCTKVLKYVLTRSMLYFARDTVSTARCLSRISDLDCCKKRKLFGAAVQLCIRPVLETEFVKK